jgi:hypothetical protein
MSRCVSGTSKGIASLISSAASHHVGGVDLEQSPGGTDSDHCTAESSQ